MGYFDGCWPDQRFTTGGRRSRDAHRRYIWPVEDWDQRRTIGVATSWLEEDENFIFEALAKHIDSVPSNATLVEIGPDGELVSTYSGLDQDLTKIPFYPSLDEFSHDVPRVRRPDLLELERMGVQVDLTALKSDIGNPDSPRFAFKYYLTPNNVAAVWHEINCLMRIPKHPGIVPFACLVIDCVDGEDRVVGYTTPFIPGDTILDNVSRPFKLKHLRQLLDAVDYLNLELGIVHGDICPRNLLINPETDHLQVFDFNFGSKLGWEGDVENSGTFGYDADRNDVKMTIFTLYEIITRDTHFRDENYAHELDISMVTGIEPWEQHPDVSLDADAAEYRQVLEGWVSAKQVRDKEITSWTQAPGRLDWPPVPEFPLTDCDGSVMRRSSHLRQTMIMAGSQFLKWQRPPSCGLPLPCGQYLLATGQILDSTTGSTIDVNDSMTIPDYLASNVVGMAPNAAGVELDGDRSDPTS